MAHADSVSDASTQHRSIDSNTSKAYLVGGGIASMAAAAFLIRDGDFLGHNITVLEELGDIGGSLDGSGSAEKGYVLAWRPDARKQVSLYLRSVFLDSHSRREQNCHGRNRRLE